MGWYEKIYDAFLKLKEAVKKICCPACTDCGQIKLVAHYRGLLQICIDSKKILLEKVESLKKQILDLEQKLASCGVTPIPLPIPSPETKGEITYSELEALLTGKSKAIFLSDETYSLITIESMKHFLDLDDTDKNKYLNNYYDCDDFSYRLMGDFSVPGWAAICIGIAWSKTHAFNVFVDSERKLYVIEPQTDSIIPFEKLQGAYKDWQVVMI